MASRASALAFAFAALALALATSASGQRMDSTFAPSLAMAPSSWLSVDTAPDRGDAAAPGDISSSFLVLVCTAGVPTLFFRTSCSVLSTTRGCSTPGDSIGTSDCRVS